jgi:predicted MFS family arabinose efflux permease
MSVGGIPTSFCRAVRFQDPDVKALRKITDAEWGRILSTWSTAKIMTSYRLDHRDGDRDILPHWVSEKIEQNLADIDLRFQKIKSAYTRVAHELKEIGADHVMIKGFSLYPGYVREFGLRPQGDIDLYCPPESVHRAQDAVVRLGYVPVTGGDKRLSDHLPTVMPITSWRPGRNLFDPEMPIGFELHHRFWNEEVMRFGVANLDEFWHRRVLRNIDGFEFPALHPVDSLGYTALNTLRDLSRGLLPIEQIYGMARFLDRNSGDTAFWELWREIHGPAVRRLEAVSFQLAENWFACKLSEGIREEIEQQPDTIKTYFRQTSESGLFPQFGQEKNGTWLHVLMLESVKDKLGILREVLFDIGSSPEDGIAKVAEAHTPNGEPKRTLATVGRRLLSYPIWFVSRSALRLGKFPSFFGLGFKIWASRFNLGKGFWSFFASSFFFDLGMYVFFVLYNLYLLDRGIKENVVGLIASALAVGGIVGAIPAGILAHRFGLRKALLTCLTMVPLIFALRSIVSGEALLIALAFLGGFFLTFWAVCISPAISQLTNEKSRAVGFSTVFSSGIAIGILGGQVGGRLPSWLGMVASTTSPAHTKQLALLVACAFVALGAIAISRVKFSSAPTKERKVYPSGRFIKRYLAAVAVWTLAGATFDPFYNVYFSKFLHMSVEQIGSVYSYAQLSQVIAMMATPIIFRKFGMVDGIVYLQVAAAITLGALAFCSRVPTASVVYVGYMALHWMTEPGIMLFLMNRVAPEERTGASALNFLVINIASALAAAIAGASFAKFGYPLVLTVASIVGLAAAFFFRLMVGEREPEGLPDARLSSRTIS